MSRVNRNNVQYVTAMHRQRAEALGISWGAFRTRLSRGWDIERASGQLAREVSPPGQRRQYRKAPRGRWSNLAYSAGRFMSEQKAVREICDAHGLPRPNYRKPMRRSPWMPKPAKRNVPEPIVVDAHDSHRDA